MKHLTKYNEFLILERYDSNVRAKLIEMGVTDEGELNKQVHFAKNGHLGAYLEEKGKIFTFGILKAIFKDAVRAKKIAQIKRGIFHVLPSALPLILVPYFPIVAVISSIFGASRMFHKIFDPLFEYINPHTKYSDYLKKMIDTCMRIPEGDINIKDRFTRAFVISDRLVEAIKPDILSEFSTYLSEKMEKEDEGVIVPHHYIENELKTYLNSRFDINPELVIKEKIKT